MGVTMKAAKPKKPKGGKRPKEVLTPQQEAEVQDRLKRFTDKYLK